MSFLLRELQASLAAADICYRQPATLDFHVNATIDDPCLLGTVNNLGIISYRSKLRLLYDKATQLSNGGAAISETLTIALLHASIYSRLTAVEEHIRSVYILQRAETNLHGIWHDCLPESASVDSQMIPILPSYDRLNATIENDTDTNYRIDAVDAAVDTEARMLHRSHRPSRLAGNASPIHVLSTISATHYNELNDKYDFFSISTTTQYIRQPPLSRYGFPIYFVDDMRSCIEKFHFWKRKSLIEIAEVHNVMISTNRPSSMRISDYLNLLMSHNCNNSCKNNVFCYIPISRARTLQSIATHERERDNRTQSRPQPLNGLSELLPYITPSSRLRYDIIKEWQYLFSTERQRWTVCAACSRRFIHDHPIRVPANSINFHLLRNPGLNNDLLPDSYDLACYDYAILNAKGLSNPANKSGLVTLCNECNTSLKDGNMPKYALANWLYYAHDRLPNQVRRDFSKSTLFEKNLICRARASRITFRYCHNPSSPQYGSNFQTSQSYSKGNIILLPQDTIALNSVLPPPPEIIRDTMAVLFIGPTVKPTVENLKRLKPCLVRKSRVRRMIDFLIRHNPYYRIDGSFRGLSASNLESLYVDSSLLDDIDGEIMPTVEIECINSRKLDVPIEVTADYTNRNDADPRDHALSNQGDLLLENVGYTIGDTSMSNFNLMKIRAFEHCNSGGAFIQSRHGSNPIPDFDNDRVMSWLFPHLDPWGIGSFHHPRRTKQLTMDEQLRYLMNVDNSPFATDPMFAFVFFNISQKRSLVRDCLFRVKQAQYLQTIEELQSISVDALQRLERKYLRIPHFCPTDPIEQRIVGLLSRIQCINYKIPGSRGYKKRLRNEIWSLIYRYGTPALFITLNPSDVHNSLVRIIVGEDINLEDATRGEDMSKFLRSKLAADNPHATAIFFDRFVRGFINVILRYGRDKPGLFGRCIAYYGTVEAQGKGTLHCHFLVWLHGHLPPQAMRDRLRADEGFKRDLFSYLESIIMNEPPGMQGPLIERNGTVTEPPERQHNEPNPATVALPRCGSLEDQRFDNEFRDMVSKLVIENHWHRHNATCWKYLRRDDPHDDAHCRMRIDGSVQALTHFDETTDSIVHRRLHPRINSYNDIITFLTQSNNDIKFIGSGDVAKALVYYITDYITKSSLPVHVGLAAIRSAMDRIREIFASSTVDPDPDQVAKSLFVKCANSILGRYEISHPQVMSYLVGSGDVYKSHVFQPLMWTLFDRIVGQYFMQTMTNHDSAMEGITEDAIPDEPNEDGVTFRVDATGVSTTTLYDDYVYRPSATQFNDLSLYDHVRLTRKATITESDRRRATTINETRGRNRAVRGSFLSDHPQADKYTLMLRTKEVVPVLLGPSLANPSRNSSAREQWCRAMLILFKPWRRPSELKTDNATWQEAFHLYSFNPFHTVIMDNISTLCECKDTRDQHSKSRTVRLTSLSSDENMEIYDRNQGDMPASSLDDEAFSIIAADVSSLSHQTPIGTRLRFRPSRILAALSQSNSMIEGVMDPSRLFIERQDSTNLKMHANYMKKLKNAKRPLARREDDPLSTHVLSNSGVENVSIGIVSNPVHAMRPGFIPAARHPETIMDQVVQEFGLLDNKEQHRAFNIVVRHIISQHDQLLMYIGGVGGTGKSHVIKSIVRYFEIMNIREQLVLTAPTGAAAIVIGGQTIHSLTLPYSVNVDIEALSSVWQYVRLLIIDEVSMIGGSLMALISKRLNQARNQTADNGMHFGGISVLFLGDHGQLRPVGDTALYHHSLLGQILDPRTINSEVGQTAIQGASAWRQVNTVVLLYQNRRQASDTAYAAMLERIRLGRACTRLNVNESIGTTIPDAEFLRKRLLSEVNKYDDTFSSRLTDIPIITGAKIDRDDMNDYVLNLAARQLNQQVHVYHSTDRMHRAPLSRSDQDYAWHLDSTTTNDALGLLPIFAGMKVMLTENVAISNRLVNGSEGIVHSIYYDEDENGRRIAKVCYVRFPGCSIDISGFPADVAPIFPTSTAFEIRRKLIDGRTIMRVINRNQLPLLPAYSYTDYKSQGRSLERAIVDLKSARSLQGAYVMLSRVKTLNGLAILRDFEDTVIEQELPSDLRKELVRLDRLNELTTQRYNCMQNDVCMSTVPVTALPLH